MFPLKVLEISKEQKERFNKYFVEEDGKFMFEGMWLSSSESCYAKGSASYQLFCQMSSQGTIKDGKCCVSY